MARSHPSRANEQRIRIAQEAARLIHEEGLLDYGQARRKAARHLGMTDESLLPRTSEIEAALREHLALFAGPGHGLRLHRLQVAAVDAMVFLGHFEPRLVGAVLDGTADLHSTVTLHLFTDQPDDVGHCLRDHGIPFDREERRLRLDPRREARVPLYLIAADDVPFELMVFPLDGLRQAPLDASGQRPQDRGSLSRVRRLIDAFKATDR